MADDTTTGGAPDAARPSRGRTRRTPARAAEPDRPPAPTDPPRPRGGRRRAGAAESEPAAVAPPDGAAAPMDAPAPRRRTRKAAPAADAAGPAVVDTAAAAASEPESTEPESTEPPPRRRRATRAAGPPPESPAESPDAAAAPGEATGSSRTPPAVVFQPPVPVAAPTGDTPAAETEGESRRRRRTPRIVVPEASAPPAPADDDEDRPGETEAERRKRRRRGRRGRGRGKVNGESNGEEAASEPEIAPAAATADEAAERTPDDAEADPTTSRRRRRRRRNGAGEPGETGVDDGVPTVVKVREPRRETEVQGVRGSTRLEAKRQRRREGRDQGRRRPPVVSEAEFLARREAVDRVMLVRQSGELTQIAVLEDGVLVEHYVTRAEAVSYAGNVYLGRVQNVLASMEAAFVDIGKGRNAVLYAGEVNYDASALEGRAPRIEQALKSGQQVVVQVTKDPMGHKGARLTSQISLPGRYMVFVPEQSMTGISRKLPDTERARLKSILKTLKPEGAGIIIRTAAEGASEEDLTADLRRLQAQWDVIQKKAKKETAPALLHAEPDLVIRVIRDTFNEDFRSLVVEGDRDYELIEGYLSTLAPDLLPRLERWSGTGGLFEAHRVDEQIAKGLDRKVSLPSGGSLVIDRTEAMTVVDVNTGKFTGKGGNLEETVTRNNLEAAEEIVRQLRLRDIGGIIVVDFIDMILESNRELVLRRLKECLGRDRTKHQVAEITSLGLLQMTRKRIGQGLLEAFSEPCADCGGRGLKVRPEFPQPGRRSTPPTPAPAPSPVPGPSPVPAPPRRRGRAADGATEPEPAAVPEPSPAAVPDPSPAAVP